jgi:DNA polymerase I-like protein with 3'-5' exonuclease and polymerase domains
MRTLIVGQIHDSILADVPRDELNDFLALANKVMTKQLRNKWKWINVPLAIEAEVCPIGGSWADKKEMEIPK